MTIIFLAYNLPDPISAELSRQGHSTTLLDELYFLSLGQM
jgi:hypothetical protein